VLRESAVKLLGFGCLSGGPDQVDLEGNQLPQRCGPSLPTDSANEIFNPRRLTSSPGLFKVPAETIHLQH
jgi:hypothetical protein